MMRIMIAGVILCLSVPALSQVQHSRAEIVEHYCHAAEVTSGPEADRAAAVHARIAPILKRNPNHHIYLFLVDSPEINAHTFFASPTQSLICIPTGIVRFMGDEGEVAFVIAHELGHAVDDVCKTEQGKASVTPPTLSGTLDRMLGGSGRTQFTEIAEKRQCESRADEIGLRIMVAAGYSPFDAAGSFGRLEMYSGDVSTGVLARFVRINSDHPITPDRIRDMRRLLVQMSR